MKGLDGRSGRKADGRSGRKVWTEGLDGRRTKGLDEGPNRMTLEGRRVALST
ncbi:hypothetical protein Tco_1470943, partial [Tanacetum coccineum]